MLSVWELQQGPTFCHSFLGLMEQLWVPLPQTQRHQTTTILLCSQILWAKSVKQAQRRWVCSAPRVSGDTERLGVIDQRDIQDLEKVATPSPLQSPALLSPSRAERLTHARALVQQVCRARRGGEPGSRRCVTFRTLFLKPVSLA